MFQKIQNQVKFSSIEEELVEQWKTNHIFEKSVEKNNQDNSFFFYDGPPFATGLPHYGHLLASTIKDVIARYQTMQGKRVVRRFGWDCHGLPVEVEAEKELKISGKTEIENYGVAEFNEVCRSIVLRYSSEWKHTIDRIGRWVDMENDFKTMDISFMESVWAAFKKLWDKGLIFKSYKILAYSPKLETPLSNFEVNLGYKMTQDPWITAAFRSLEEKDTFFLAWTTTPWTLPSNLALAVNPNETYVKVECEQRFYYLAKARVEAVFKDKENYAIVEEKQGIDLCDTKYEPLFPFFSELTTGKVFHVLPADYVTLDAGTGIVHIAPSFGEEDFNLGKQHNLPHIFPLDNSGHFTDEAGEFATLFFKDADRPITQHLKNRSLVFSQGTLEHSYPFCWRTGVPLMYRTIQSWFVDVEAIKDKLQANNQSINWVPSFIKDGRMGKWLEGARPWVISRNRFWGNPIPVWICQDCGKEQCIGSQEELSSLSNSVVTDLHSHFIDKLTWSCSSCNGTMKRTSEVLDCWFESGSMPYAQEHYPFENKEQFESQFPADFITEGLDQTRGWFYTLLVLSTALFEKPAFKNCIVSGMLLAEDGRKMSKSLKNYPDPQLMLDKYGADCIRLYMLNSGAIRGEELCFSELGLQEVIRNTLIPLWNSLYFLVTYANTDNWQPVLITSPEETNNLLDKWILSRMQTLIQTVGLQLDEYNLNRAVTPFVTFIDHLTNWYIRRSRRRFWKSDHSKDKRQAYSTLYTVLFQVSHVLAPFMPFLSEKIYSVLTSSTEKQSVHLQDFPVVNPSFIQKDLEEAMEIVLESIVLGRSLRAKENLKLRQPLRCISIVAQSNKILNRLKPFSQIIMEELNVKRVIWTTNEEELVTFQAKPNLKKLGPKWGKVLREITPKIAELTSKEIAAILRGASKQIQIGEQTLTLKESDLFVERKQKEGLLTNSSQFLTVALDTVLKPKLEQEGLAREVINKIQQTRKENNLNVSDRIIITIETNSTQLRKAIKRFYDYINAETLATSINFAKVMSNKKWDINSYSCKFEIKVVVIDIVKKHEKPFREWCERNSLAEATIVNYWKNIRSVIECIKGVYKKDVTIEDLINFIHNKQYFNEITENCSQLTDTLLNYKTGIRQFIKYMKPVEFENFTNFQNIQIDKGDNIKTTINSNELVVDVLEKNEELFKIWCIRNDIAKTTAVSYCSNVKYVLGCIKKDYDKEATVDDLILFADKENPQYFEAIAKNCPKPKEALINYRSSIIKFVTYIEQNNSYINFRKANNYKNSDTNEKVSDSEFAVYVLEKHKELFKNKCVESGDHKPVLYVTANKYIRDSFNIIDCIRKVHKKEAVIADLKKFADPKNKQYFDELREAAYKKQCFGTMDLQKVKKVWSDYRSGVRRFLLYLETKK